MALIGNRFKVLNKSINEIEELEINRLYKARDVYENTKVLIKVVDHNHKVKEHFISNLIDESTTLRHVNSDYIAKMLEVGVHCTEEKTYYYIVYEYFAGIELEQMISGNYLHLEAIINIATQISKALKVAHINNMYHGDLNPKNIIIDKMYNIKICDFGITKSNQGVNLRLSSLSYLCPHQLNIDYTDIESDFFSLGLILFECIFKKLPFETAKSELDMLKNIDKGIDWNNIKAINGNKDLISIIKKLLDRTNKYKYIQDILIDLSKVMYEKADIEIKEVNKDNIEEIDNKRSSNNKISPKKFLLCSALITLITIALISSI